MAVADPIAQAGAAHALELQGVSRAFGALVALDDVSLNVGAGERRWTPFADRQEGLVEYAQPMEGVVKRPLARVLAGALA